MPGFTNSNPLTLSPFITDHTPHLSPVLHQKNVLFSWCSLHLPFTLSSQCCGGWYDPLEATPPPLPPSLIGCPGKDAGACRRLIISCFLMRWRRGREIPGLASEIIIVSIPPHRTSSSWLLLPVSSSWKICIMSAPLH